MNITFSEEQFLEILFMFKGEEITPDQAIELLEIIGIEGGSPRKIAENRGMIDSVKGDFT